MTQAVRKRRKYKHRRNLLKLAIFAILACGSIAGMAYILPKLPASSVTAEVGANVDVGSGQLAWWNPNFAWRENINTRGAKTLAKIEINHANLVSEKKSLADGTDLQIVAQIGDAADAIYSQMTGVNTPHTTIVFDVEKYPSAKYFLYYGNRNPKMEKVLGARIEGTNFSLAETGGAEAPLVQITSTRLWHIIQDDQVKVDLNISTSLQVQKLSYAFVDTQDKGDIADFTTGSKTLSVTIPNPPTGNKDLYLIAHTDQGVKRSNSINLNISAPMYVAWTIDWEGYDIKDSILNDAQDIAKRFNIPLTHFFNPRIFVAKEISQFRRDKLVNWVKSRSSVFGDEIQLHLHMHYDMVQAAGVKLQTVPRWGTGRDGYDVLTTNYSYSDFSKMLDWAKSQFAANGLPQPKGYRAGGWFANLETLKALNDAGFTYDSSGREKYSFGNQNKPGYWELPFTQQPYRPSSTNQNASEPGPQLNLWEIPNNGNDSYWFNADQLKNRFYQNYVPGSILEQSKLVTYISHFDWFETDKTKLNALFPEIQKYRYEDDKGPVIYVTLTHALKDWQQ